MDLAVTGLGMVSSIGHGVVQACAALRAGIIRARPLPYFEVLDEETQELVPVTAHPVHGFTDGFGPVGRWLRLAKGCVDDLMAQEATPAAADESYWGRTGLIWVGPVLDHARFLEPRQMGDA